MGGCAGRGYQRIRGFAGSAARTQPGQPARTPALRRASRSSSARLSSPVLRPRRDLQTLRLRRRRMRSSRRRMPPRLESEQRRWLPVSHGSADAVAFFDADAEGRSWKLHLKLRGDADGGRKRQRRRRRGVTSSSNPKIRGSTSPSARVIEKWGTGYARNPTAFVSPKESCRSVRSSLREPRPRHGPRRPLRRGTNISLYALDGAAPRRVYRLVAGTDVSLHFRHDGDGTQQGISAARVFGDALELHARGRAPSCARSAAIHVRATRQRRGRAVSRRRWTRRARVARLSIQRPTSRTTRKPFAPRTRRIAAAHGAQLRLRPHRLSHTTSSTLELIAITNLRDGSLLARATLSLQRAGERQRLRHRHRVRRRARQRAVVHAGAARDDGRRTRVLLSHHSDISRNRGVCDGNSKLQCRLSLGQPTPRAVPA